MDYGDVPSGSDRARSQTIDASPIFHPAPRRLSRSPKRVRSTPPTKDTSTIPPLAAPLPNTSCANSSCQREWTRPTLSTRRGVSYESPHDRDHERHVKTSPWIGRIGGGLDNDAPSWGLNMANSRRREMSVPLVSDRLCETSGGVGTGTAHVPRSLGLLGPVMAQSQHLRTPHCC